MINSQNALQRFKTMFSGVSQQLEYIKQIVQFMDFDNEAINQGLSGEDQGQTLEDVAKEMNMKLNKSETNLKDIQVELGEQPEATPNVEGRGEALETQNSQVTGKFFGGEPTDMEATGLQEGLNFSLQLKKSQTSMP
jgi:hypothetical protein